VEVGGGGRLWENEGRPLADLGPSSLGDSESESGFVMTSILRLLNSRWSSDIIENEAARVRLDGGKSQRVVARPVRAGLLFGRTAAAGGRSPASPSSMSRWKTQSLRPRTHCQSPKQQNCLHARLVIAAP
jgi:hypothetical protein